MSLEELEASVGRLESDRAEMAERLTRLEDEREIRELLSRYAFTADLGRSQEYVDLYTEDGTIDLGAGRASEGAFVGQKGLYSFITAAPHKCIEGHAQHHATCGPLIIHLNGDEAIAEGYSLVIVESDEAQRRARSCFPMAAEINVGGANFNRWTLQRVDGSWRIRERMNRSIGTDEVHEVIRDSLGSRRPDAELAS